MINYRKRRRNGQFMFVFVLFLYLDWHERVYEYTRGTIGIELKDKVGTLADCIVF